MAEPITAIPPYDPVDDYLRIVYESRLLILQYNEDLLHRDELIEGKGLPIVERIKQQIEVEQARIDAFDAQEALRKHRESKPTSKSRGDNHGTGG